MVCNSIETELNSNDYPVPDILLIDYRLHDNQTGLQVIKNLRSRFKLPIPAIIITGETDASIIQLIRESGCTLLNKPVNTNALKQTIAETIQVRA